MWCTCPGLQVKETFYLAYQDFRQTHWNECACHPASPNIQSMAGYRVSSLNHCGVITLVFISIYNFYNTYSLVVGSQMTKSLSPALREPQILHHTFPLPFPENRRKNPQPVPLPFLALHHRPPDFWSSKHPTRLKAARILGDAMDRMIWNWIKNLAVRVQKVWLFVDLFFFSILQTKTISSTCRPLDADSKASSL